ncbi:MAG: hypothetical protein P8107_10765 [Spirochaetia bacterium]
MNRWEKAGLFLFCILLFFSNCTMEQKPAKIFFVNLFYDVIDIRLGDETDPVYTAKAVKPFSYAPVGKTVRFGRYQLYFKSSNDNRWNSWNFSGDDNYSEIKPGKIYCIAITTDGAINYFSMNEETGEGAKVCFFNASPIRVSDMRVVLDSAQNLVADIQDLDSNMLSNFYTIPPGRYLLFWQFPFQKSVDEYLFYTQKGTNVPKAFAFRQEHYYVFLICTESDTTKALFFDISPTA